MLTHGVSHVMPHGGTIAPWGMSFAPQDEPCGIRWDKHYYDAIHGACHVAPCGTSHGVCRDTVVRPAVRAMGHDMWCAMVKPRDRP